jgi:hypothetical protein
MSTQLLTVTGGFDICIPPASMAERDKLLKGSAHVTVVRDPADQEIAVASLRDLKALLKAVEKARSEVKAPVLDTGRKIDTLAADFIVNVTAEANRIGNLIAAFQVAERRRVEEEERQRQVKIREQEEIERQRLAKLAEEEAKLNAPTATEADLNRAVAAETAAVEQTKKVEEIIRAPLPQIRRQTGMVTTNVLCFEVTDIHALYRAAPHLVRLEANAAAIKATCTANGPEIPGLKLWSETRSTVRV